jgi:amino acid permease
MWLFKTRALLVIACILVFEVMFATTGILRRYPEVAAIPAVIYGAVLVLMIAARRREKRRQPRWSR